MHRANLAHPVDGLAYPYVSADGEPLALAGPWELSFTSGGPELPSAATITKLGSWTDLAGEAVKNFAGLASYRTEFPKPEAAADAYVLDFGEVH
ncbi:MAG: hypothetical protein QM755_19805 [Luteolibacter sp.]